MPLLMKKRQLVAKIESTSGTAESLTASDVIGLAYDFNVSPNVEMIDRPKQGSAAHELASVGLQGASVSFRTDLYGDGAGTTPVAFETLLPACGFTQTVDTFSGLLEAPGTNVKTLTIAVYEDGRRKLLAGCAGNAVLVLESGKPSAIEWTFTGKWSGVTDTALLSPTLPTNKPFRFANTSLTMSSWEPCVQQVRIDLGNVVQLRECQSASDGTGYAGGIITDRKTMITVNPEAALVATEDVYGDWLAMTEAAFAVGFDDGTDTFDISATVQATNIQSGDRNGMITDDITYQVNDDDLQLEWGTA